MKRVPLLAIPVLAVVAVLGWSHGARAADEKTAKGTVTAVSADSISLKVGDKEMKFNVDDKTKVVASGAGHKEKAAQTAGMAGPKLTEVMKAGQAAQVSYSEAGGMMHASEIRSISSAGGGAMSEDKPAAKTAAGPVKSVSATSLVVTSGSSDMTFAVDASTKVVGTGVGTKTKAMGGKASITDLVAAGDKVTVTYTDAGGTMHASNVRINSKAAK